MDSFRKQLDVLMGANRNGDVREVSRKYYDRDVCRLYLAGLCPHDLFQLTVCVLPPWSPSFHYVTDLEHSSRSGLGCRAVPGFWWRFLIFTCLCFAEDGHGAVPEAALVATAQRVSFQAKSYFILCICLWGLVFE